MSVEPETRHERGARERSNEKHLFLVSRFALYLAKLLYMYLFYRLVMQFFSVTVIEERSLGELNKRVLVKEAVMPN